MASFGFSVGDFITCLSLVREITQALRDSTGSVADYKSFLQTLNSLNQAFTTSEVIYLQWQDDVGDPKYSSNAQAMVNGMLFERQQCKILMERFLKASEPYSDAFLKRRERAVVRGWRKITWLSQKEDIHKLERDLQGHMHAMQISAYALFQHLMAHHTKAMDSQFQRLFSCFVDMRTDISAMSKSIQASTSRLPRSLGYPWEACSSLAENVLLLDANGRSLLLPMLFLSSPQQFHELLKLIYRGIPGHRRILRKEYTITNEDSDGTMVQKSNWDNVIRAGIQLSLNIILQASSSLKKHHCPRCDEPTLGHTLPGNRRRCHKCELTYRLFEHERVVEGNTVIPASETVNSTSPEHNASEAPEPDSGHETKRKDELFIPEEFYFKHVHYHREIQIIKTSSSPTPIVEVESQQLKVEDLPPLHRAAANGSLAEIGVLLDNSEMVDSPLPFNVVLDKPVGGRQEFRGCSPLHLATYFGRAKSIELLLDRGADIYAKDRLAAQPLHYTLTGGNYAVAMLLLSRGADVNAPNKHGNSFLHRVCQKGIMWLLSPILEYGGDLAAKNKNGSNALHVAAFYGQEEIVETLLGKDIATCIAAMDNYGETPLHDAAWNGSAKITAALLEHGASSSLPGATGRTPLHLASYRRNYEVARLLLERGCSVSVQEKNEDTPLHNACYNGGSERIVRLLLESGADPATKGDIGLTPLHIVSLHSDCKVARVLLEYGCSISAQEEAGYTPLHCACCSNGAESFVRLLLEHGADIGMQNANGATALHIASWSGNIPIMKVLLEAGAVKLLEIKDNAKLTPLLYACCAKNRSNNTEAIKLLLSHGANVKIQDEDGDTPLHFMIRAGNSELSTIMLESGADFDAQTNDGDTPLSIASRHAHAEMVEILLKYGAGVNTQNREGNTPLHVASYHGHEVVGKALLKHGAGPNVQNKVGSTPLHMASYKGHEAMVKVLLENGAKAMATGHAGDTPLHLASRKGHAEAVKHLIEYGGIGTNTRNSHGRTPFRNACIHGHESVAKLLIVAADDVNAFGTTGMSPLHSAAHNNHEAIVRLLLKHGVDPTLTTSRKYTALHIASGKGYLGAVQILAESGADLNAQNEDGLTALHLACYKDSDLSFKVVEYLLDEGSDPFIKDKLGRTALDFAETQNLSEIEALLRKRMGLGVDN